MKLFKKKKKEISLRDHYERRNKILVKRRVGGFGDILMQRMMFEDMNNAGFEVTFTCPIHFLDMAKDHPFASCVDIGSVKEEEFGAVYDITTACRVHECRQGANNRDHRSDIWAAHCGVHLKNHNMHLRPDPAMLQQCEAFLKHHNPDRPSVLIASHSGNDDFGIGKSLTDEQVVGVVESLRSQGYYVFTVHNKKQVVYDRLGVDQFTQIHPLAWVALVQLADYTISVDTATFHMAGGLKRPLVGVFSFTDGKVYGKYYDFVLVQKHRDDGWDCGPCFNMSLCPKSERCPKPCLTEITADDILAGFAVVSGRSPSAGSGRRTLDIIPPART